MIKTFGIIMALCMCVACGGGRDVFELDIRAPKCNNMWVSIVHETDRGLECLDSAKVEMGRARLGGRCTRPELMYLFMEGAQDYLPIFVESGVMDVEYNPQKPGKSVVDGSQSHKILTDFLQSYAVYSSKAAGHEKMSQNASVLGDTLMIERIESDMGMARQEVIDFQVQFVNKYIDHPIACYILETSLSRALPDSLLSSITKKIPQANHGDIHYRRMAARLNKGNNTI